MKKLSLLIAMILCVTIGGVYASWNYVQEETIGTVDQSISINITEPNKGGTYGSFAIAADGCSLKVDPKEGTTHITALYITGKIVVTCTLNYAVATEDMRENGIPAKFEFTITSPTFDDDTTDGVAAKTILRKGTVAEEAHNITWTKVEGTDNKFTFEIDATEIAKHLVLEEFNLDTYAKYEDFHDALAGVSINFAVTDTIAENPAQA